VSDTAKCWAYNGRQLEERCCLGPLLSGGVRLQTDRLVERWTASLPTALSDWNTQYTKTKCMKAVSLPFEFTDFFWSIFGISLAN
jgi:hypothetical protein